MSAPNGMAEAATSAASMRLGLRSRRLPTVSFNSSAASGAEGGLGSTSAAAAASKCNTTGKWVALAFGIVCILAIVVLIVALVLANQKVASAHRSTTDDAAGQAQAMIHARAKATLAAAAAAGKGNATPAPAPPAGAPPTALAATRGGGVAIDDILRSGGPGSSATSFGLQSSPATGATSHAADNPGHMATYAHSSHAQMYGSSHPAAAGSSGAWLGMHPQQYGAAAMAGQPGSAHDTSQLAARMAQASRTAQHGQQAAAAYAAGGQHPVAFSTGAGGGFVPYGVPPPPAHGAGQGQALAATSGYRPTFSSALPAMQEHISGHTHAHMAHSKAQTSAYDSQHLWEQADIGYFDPKAQAAIDKSFQVGVPAAFNYDVKMEEDRRHKAIIAQMMLTGKVEPSLDEILGASSPYIATAALIRRATAATAALDRQIILQPALRFVYDSPMYRPAVSMPAMTLTTDSMTPAQEAYYLEISCDPPCGQADGF
jgi:hypothetical protein